MCQYRAVVLYCCLGVFTIQARSQGLGQQGTDPYTGQPANPTAAGSLPDTSGRGSLAAEEGRRLVLRSHTLFVEVPAVVTDASGNHVHNLTKDDFKILENGKPERIAICNEVIASGGHIAQSALPAGTFSNATVEGHQQFAVTVIALDTINTPFLDQTFGRKQLLKYLGNNLDSGQVMALVVISSKGLKVTNRAS